MQQIYLFIQILFKIKVHAITYDRFGWTNIFAALGLAL